MNLIQRGSLVNATKQLTGSLDIDFSVERRRNNNKYKATVVRVYCNPPWSFEKKLNEHSYLERVEFCLKLPLNE